MRACHMPERLSLQCKCIAGSKDVTFQKRECLLTRLPHLKCIRLGSVRSSLRIFMHVRSIATPFTKITRWPWNFIPLNRFSDARILQEFPGGIPCRSNLLPKTYQDHPKIKSMLNEYMVGFCKVQLHHWLFVKRRARFYGRTAHFTCRYIVNITPLLAKYITLKINQVTASRKMTILNTIIFTHRKGAPKTKSTSWRKPAASF